MSFMRNNASVVDMPADTNPRREIMKDAPCVTLNIDQGGMKSK